jgi:hypothetical protein
MSRNIDDIQTREVVVGTYVNNHMSYEMENVNPYSIDQGSPKHLTATKSSDSIQLNHKLKQ